MTRERTREPRRLAPRPVPSRPRVFGLAALVLVLGASVLSCAARIPPPSTPPPAFDRPSAVIPGDLDVALRVDLVALGRFLGPDARGAFGLTLADPKEDPEAAAFVASAFERADVLWVAFRPGSSAARTDNVVILRGRFAHLSPPRQADGKRGGFGGPLDLGGAFRVHERPKPARRSAPSRIYARADDWLVFVSEAEIDSVERAIEQRAGDPHVDPQDRGIAALSLRPAPVVRLLEERFPALRPLADATRLDVVAEAAPGGLAVWLEIRFEDAELAHGEAPRVRELVDALRDARGLAGRVARQARVEELGGSVVVRTLVDAEALAALLGCAAGEGGC